MSNINIVNEASHLTLHYRLATIDGVDIISTYGESPATLQIGAGQLAPPLESALIGLAEGSHTVRELSPEHAFGPRNDELIRKVSIATLRENSAFGEKYVVGDLVEFSAPSGGTFAGVIKSVDEEGAIFDFNHPLAGQTLVFETNIIGIL